MSTRQIFVLAVAAVAVMAAIAIFAVAYRRSEDDAPAGADLDRRAVRRDRARVRARAAAVAAEPGAVTVLEPEVDVEVEEEEPPPDPLELREEVSPEQYGVSRRMFFNRALAAVFGVFLLQLAIGFLAFLWPKLKAGGFGGKIDAGDVDDIRSAIAQADGTVAPLFVPAAQAYIVPFSADPDDTSFSSVGNFVIAGDLMALWQRCVHLGCRVPVCLPSQGFECPCHGSKYNFHGEYEDGPAPRNMDRFEVEINENNRLIVNTGAIFQTARAKTKTIPYPQGPSCLSASAGEEA